MAEITNRKINIYIETGAAQKSFDTLDQKAKALQKQLAETTNKGDIKRIKKELDAISEPLDRAKKKLSGELAPSMKDLQKVVKDLGNQLHRMSTTDADFSKVLQQYTQAKGKLTEIKDEVKKVEQAQQGAGKSTFLGSFFGNLAAGVISGAASMVTGFFKGAVDEAMQAEEATARFQATLDNMGRADVFDRITAKADQMAQKFKYLDNDDVVGVFNKLIDYGKLTEKQMNDLLPVIIDFAAKQRIPIEEATGVITKALEGNGKALKTYGISISEASTPAERLKVIMTDLKDKVDGAGEAFQNTAAGGAAVARQEFKNLQEEIGTNLLPALNKVMNFISGAIKGLRGITRAAEEQAQINARVDDAIVQSKIKVFEQQIKEGKKTKAEIIAQMEELKKVGKLSATGSAVLSYFKPDVLGTGDPNADPEAEKAAEAKRKAAEAKRKAEADKIKGDQLKLAEELKKIRGDLSVFNASEQDKEIQRTIEKYTQLRKLAHGNAEQLAQIDVAMQDEVFQIMVKYGQKELEQAEKMDAQKEAEQQKRNQQMIERGREHLIKFGQMVAAQSNAINRNQTASIELELLKAHGTQRLELNKKLLQEQMRQELQNTDLTQKERELIVERYKKKELEMEQAHWQNVASIMLEFVGQALQVLDQFNQAKTQRENSDLERDRKINDKKKSNLDRQLKGKQITQMEYDRKVAEMDRVQEAKEKDAHLKQFKRQQRLAVVNAIIGGAMAAQKTLSEWGMPLAIPWLALTAASTIAQIATITAQKAPEFAHGGLLNGPSHGSRTNGMPVINPNTGRVQAYLEGGEAITNKRTMQDRGIYTATGTPSQIISSLNGIHGGVQWMGGATLRPSWSTTPPPRMNFDAINQSYRTVRYYAQGGVFDGGAGSGQPQLDMAVLQQMAQVVQDLQQTLATGIPAFVSLSNLQDQAARKTAIINQATMK